MKRLLKGNVLWLSLISLLNDTASEMIFPLLPVFLVGTLGAGATFLGVVEGVAETTASFVKLGGGWLADRVRRRKPLVVVGYGVAAVVRPVMAVVTAPWHVLAIRFTDRVGKGVRTAPRDALLAESVEAGWRGRAFGVHRAADHAGAVLGPLVASGLLLLWPGRLRLVFALTLVPGLLALAVAALRVRERRPDRGAPGAGAATREDAPDRVTAPSAAGAADTSGREPEPAARTVQPAEPGAPPHEPSPDPADAAPDMELRDLGRPFVGYLAVLVVFTLGNASDAFLLLRAQDLGVSLALIPLLWGALHVSKMVWNVVGGALADRLGPRRAIIAGWLVYAATYAGFAAAGTAWHAWALFGLYGLFYGLTEAPEKALVAGLAPSAVRARAFGAYHFAIGIAALPASVVFGAVWERWGADTAFLLGGGLALLAAALLPLAVSGRGGPSPEPAPAGDPGGPGG